MERLIEEAGLKYAVATAYEQTFWGPNATLEHDLLLEDVDVSKYAGVLLPCMSAGVPGTIEASSVEIVREAVAQGKPVAAQHGQICTLARAGLLTGKRYAYVHPSFREGVYAGTGVVQDGLVLTSANCPDWALRTGEPDGTVELTLRLIAAIVR